MEIQKTQPMKINKQRMAPPEDPFKKIARSMEENFIKFMIEKMRKSVPTVEKDSTAQNYYKSLIDQERAKIMASTNGGIGLQKLILDQISPYAKQAYQKAAKGIANEQR